MTLCPRNQHRRRMAREYARHQFHSNDEPRRPPSPASAHPQSHPASLTHASASNSAELRGRAERTTLPTCEKELSLLRRSRVDLLLRLHRGESANQADGPRDDSTDVDFLPLPRGRADHCDLGLALLEVFPEACASSSVQSQRMNYVRPRPARCPCGSKFLSRNPKSRYCSDDCRLAARRAVKKKWKVVHREQMLQAKRAFFQVHRDAIRIYKKEKRRQKRIARSNGETVLVELEAHRIESLVRVVPRPRFS